MTPTSESTIVAIHFLCRTILIALMIAGFLLESKKAVAKRSFSDFIINLITAILIVLILIGAGTFGFGY